MFELSFCFFLTWFLFSNKGDQNIKTNYKNNWNKFNVFNKLIFLLIKIEREKARLWECGRVGGTCQDSSIRQDQIFGGGPRYRWSKCRLGSCKKQSCMALGKLPVLHVSTPCLKWHSSWAHLSLIFCRYEHCSHWMCCFRLMLWLGKFKYN